MSGSKNASIGFWQRAWHKLCWLAGIPLLLVAVAIAGNLTFDQLPNALRWPARIIIAGSLIAGVIQLPQHVKLLAMWFVDWWQPFFNRIERVARRWRMLVLVPEGLIAIILAAYGVIHFGQVAVEMSHASLRVDELGSVEGYTAKGPVKALTNYSLAKNHVFYSFVNALTPGGDSLHPARARMWSFIAVGLCLVVAAYAFARQQLYFCGGLAVFLIGTNTRLLEQLFEARGFSFIALAALVQVLAMWRWLEGGHAAKLAILVIAAVLGVWTLPYYVLFGGLLLLILFMYRPCRSVFAAGTIAGILMLVMYAPILEGVLSVADSYEDDYGIKFHDIQNVFYTMALVLPRELVAINGTNFMAAIIVLLLACVIGPRASQSMRATLAISSALVLFFLCFCLYLQTPPPRTVSFIGPPAAVLFAMAAGLLFRPPQMLVLRLPCALVLAALLLPFGHKTIINYDFVPRENWRDGARIIAALQPGGGTVLVHGDGYGKRIDAHLDDKFEIIEFEGLPPSATAIACFDASYKRQHKQIDLSELSGFNTMIELPVSSGKRQAVFINVVDELEIVNGDNPGVMLPAESTSLAVVIDGLPVADVIGKLQIGNKEVSVLPKLFAGNLAYFEIEPSQNAQFFELVARTDKSSSENFVVKAWQPTFAN